MSWDPRNPEIHTTLLSVGLAVGKEKLMAEDSSVLQDVKFKPIDKTSLSEEIAGQINAAHFNG